MFQSLNIFRKVAIHILLPFATHCRYHDLGPRPTSQNAAAFSIPTPAPMSWTKRIGPKRVTHHDSSWSIIFLKPLINVLGFPPKIFLMGGKQFEYFECSWLVLLTSVLDVIESCFKNGSLLMHARILAPFSLVVILVHLSSFVTRIFPPLAGHREQAWGYLWEAEVRQRRLQNLLVNHLQEPGASGWEPWIYTGRKGSICSILLEFAVKVTLQGSNPEFVPTRYRRPSDGLASSDDVILESLLVFAFTASQAWNCPSSVAIAVSRFSTALRWESAVWLGKMIGSGLHLA